MSLGSKAAVHDTRLRLRLKTAADTIREVQQGLRAGRDCWYLLPKLTDAYAMYGGAEGDFVGIRNVPYGSRKRLRAIQRLLGATRAKVMRCIGAGRCACRS